MEKLPGCDARSWQAKDVEGNALIDGMGWLLGSLDFDCACAAREYLGIVHRRGIRSTAQDWNADKSERSRVP